MSFQSSRLHKSAKPMVSNSEDSDYEPVQKLPSKKKRKPMDDDDLPPEPKV